MKDVLNITFMNQNSIVDNDEIINIIVPSERSKLDTIINEDPIVIPGVVTTEDETGEQVDAVFLFAILRNENIDCNLIFKAVLGIRNFCLENNLKFSHYDEYNIQIDDLGNIKSYITKIEINNLLNMLLEGIWDNVDIYIQKKNIILNFCYFNLSFFFSYKITAYYYN